MNKEEDLLAGEDWVPNEETVNEAGKADTAKDEEISFTASVAQTEQAAIINPQTEKEMEVHHHTHPGHHKKT